MNCSKVRDQLAGLLYGEFEPAEKASLERHLADCPACHREYQALEEVRRRLNAVPAPEGRVDLPELYRQAALREMRRVRRWRRLALWVSGAAALLALLAIGLRLEARFEPHQLVLRWGSPPPTKVIPPAQSPDGSPPADPADSRSAATLEEQLQLHSKLIHALADSFQALERQERQDADRLQVRLQALQQQNSQRWLAINRTIDALYTLSQKGE